MVVEIQDWEKRQSIDHDEVRQAGIRESVLEIMQESYEFSTFGRSSSTDASRHTGYFKLPQEGMGDRCPTENLLGLEANLDSLFLRVL